MSTIKQAAGPGENPQSVGRITPVNMQSDKQRLDATSLMNDIAKSGNTGCDASDCHHCPFWA